jgi:hypothetical protein
MPMIRRKRRIGSESYRIFIELIVLWIISIKIDARMGVGIYIYHRWVLDMMSNRHRRAPTIQGTRKLQLDSELPGKRTGGVVQYNQWDTFVVWMINNISL